MFLSLSRTRLGTLGLGLTALLGTVTFGARAEVRPTGALTPVACTNLYGDLGITGGFEYCIERGSTQLYLSRSWLSAGQPQRIFVPLARTGTRGIDVTRFVNSYQGSFVEPAGTPPSHSPYHLEHVARLTVEFVGPLVSSPGRPGQPPLPDRVTDTHPGAMPVGMTLTIDGRSPYGQHRSVRLHPVMVTQ